MSNFNVASKRHIISAILVGCLLLTACGAIPSAQTQTKIYTIGVLIRGSNLAEVLVGFKAGMEELGYNDKNLAYVVKELPSNSADDVKAGLKALIDSKVDMVLALSSPVALVVKEATAGTDLPVVFAPGGDPVKAGLVQSLKNPGANLTGIATGFQYPTRLLEYLMKLVPNARRVFMVFDSKNLGAGFFAPIKEAAPKLGLELVVQNVTSNDEVVAALDKIPTDVDAVLMIPDPWVYNRIQDLIDASIKRKLPLLAGDNAEVKLGALIGYSWEYRAVGKQASRIADKVIKGEKPSSLPVETAEYFLKVNLKTSQAIGISLEDSILRQAAEVVR
jgi:putative ABC transport system substrate-binding protein